MDNRAAGKFINSIIKNLQLLCHSDIQFNENVEIIGHLYLNVDSGSKYNYFVNEKVCKSDESSTVFQSNSFHAEPVKVDHSRDADGISDTPNLNSKSNDKDKIDNTNNEENEDAENANVIQNSKPKLFSVSRRTERYKNGSRNSSSSLSESFKLSPSFPMKKPRLNSSQSSDEIHPKTEPDKGGNFNQFNLSSAFSYHKENHHSNNSQSSSHPYSVDLTAIKAEPKNISDDEEEFVSDSIRNQSGSIYGDEESLSDYSATNEQLLNLYSDAINQHHHSGSHLPSLPSSSSTPSSLFSPSQNISASTNYLTVEDGSYAKTRFRCPLCEKSFSFKTNVQRHIKERHFPTKFKCRYCAKKFSRPGNLNDHMIQCHRTFANTVQTDLTDNGGVGSGMMEEEEELSPMLDRTAQIFNYLNNAS